MSTKKKNSCYKRVSTDEGQAETIWSLLVDDLTNFDYWKDTSPLHWDVTSYDTAMVKRIPITKRRCHDLFGKDLLTLKGAFTQHTIITKRVKQLQKQLEGISKNEINQKFWTQVAPNLANSLLSRISIDANLENTSLRLSWDTASINTAHAAKTAAASSSSTPCASSSDTTESASPDSSGTWSLTTLDSLNPPRCFSSSPVQPAPSDPSVTSTIATSSSDSLNSPTCSSSSPVQSATSDPSVTSTIATSSSNSLNSPTCSSSSPVQSATSDPSVTSTVATSNSESLLEYDSVYLKSRLSIGTIIKRKALALLERQQSGEVLFPRERKIMANGLSSILDIADQSYESQKSLFTSDEWCNIATIMAARHPLATLGQQQTLVTIWKVVCESMKESRNLKSGVLYLYKMYYKHHGTSLIPYLKVMEHVLEIIDHHPHLLERKSIKKVSEYDYLGFLWMPLFSRLFEAEYNIRLKTGETCYNYSATKKGELYYDAAHVRGFKIDLRCLVDLNQAEYDLCSMEVCCDDVDDSKLVADEGKLNREMKDDLDAMIDMGQAPSECCSWGVQICGSSCMILSIHLTDEGLYVVVKRFELSLPSCIADLSEFMETMQALLTFRHYIIQAADSTTKHAKRKNSFGILTGHLHRSIDSRQRSTWYTPPEKMLPRRPIHFTGHPPLPLTTRLLEEEIKTKAMTSPVAEDDDESTDEFGWRKDEHCWYNKYTHESTTDDPYQPAPQ